VKLENPIGQNQAKSATLAPLALLGGAIAHHLRGHAVQLDLRFLAAQPHVAAGSGGEPTLVVRISAGFAHLAYFPATSAVGAPCPECFDRRALSMRTIEEQWAAHHGYWAEGVSSPFLLDTMCDTIGLLCAAQCEQAAARPGAQEVWTLDLASNEVRVDELLADSFCTSCSPSLFPTEENSQLALRERLRAQSGLGRMVPLLDFKLPAKALINPVCGAAAPAAIPGYVQSITAPVFAQYLQRAFESRARVVGWSGLCLRTDESSAAGLLEALERQAGMLAHPSATATVDSYRNLGERAMDPTLCFAYSEQCYEANLGLTRYDHDMAIEWVWGYSLMQRRPIMVPRQMAYYDRIHTDRRIKLADNNSSGCALGSCYEEAILKGLCELIERDSFVLAWHRQLSLPHIDPASCTDRKTRLVLNRMDYLGFDISLLDGRLDMKVPTVIAVARRRDGQLGAMTVGGCASLDPNEAVRSALLECATSIVEMPAMFNAQEKRIRSLVHDFSRVETVMDHSLLYAIPEMAAKLSWLHTNPTRRSFADSYRDDRDWHAQGDIGADLNKILRELGRCGIDDAVVVDLTTPEQRLLDLRTVRVIVPGLAPIDFGHPRNRVEHLPRLRLAPAAAGLASPAGHVGNVLPHPFP
jgi:ribosomal protein S12 methylthiotransferase accessory factor